MAPERVKAAERCAFAPGSTGRQVIEYIVRSCGRVATMHSGCDKDIDISVVDPYCESDSII